MKKYYIHISSVTGNTRKLAQYILDHLSIDYEVIDPLHMEYMEGEDVILFFWCRRSNMDTLTLKVLSKLHNCHILALGTMGSYTDSAYGSHVHELVEDTISVHNHFLGAYICRGAIDPARTMKRRNLPPDHPHYLDDKSYARHLSSQGHPDKEDLEQALIFLHQFM